MRRCHQHGTTISAEIAQTETIRPPEYPQLAGSLSLSSVKFAANRRPRFGAPRRAAFYYFLLVADALILSWRSISLKNRACPQLPCSAGHLPGHFSERRTAFQ